MLQVMGMVPLASNVTGRKGTPPSAAARGEGGVVIAGRCATTCM